MKENYEDLEGFVEAVREYGFKKIFLSKETSMEDDQLPTEKGMVQAKKITGVVRLTAGKIIGEKLEVFILHNEAVVRTISVADDYAEFNKDLEEKTKAVMKELQKEISSVRVELGVCFP